ncbi:hypothetical protein FACS189446_7890 [Bacteroidia bacterium]|nr:hypothetical protein FACS189446_7890 [Bacteroidia bacterium]
MEEKMKKVLFLWLMFALVPGMAQSQVRIGKQGKPAAGSVLDLKSPPPGGYLGGLVLPRVEIINLLEIPNNFIGWNEIDPLKLAGMLVYHTAESSIPKGVYVWDGAKWVKING